MSYTQAFNLHYDVDEYILLLRFGSLKPQQGAKCLCSYSEISNLLNISYSKVIKVCKESIGVNRKCYKPRNPWKMDLDSEQKLFLISAETLEAWKGHSLQDRTLLFHRLYPDKTITVSQLVYLYRQNGIKYKTMKSTFKFSEQKMQHILQLRCQRYQQFIGAIESRKKIIYIDEVIFKPYQISQRSWALKGQNQLNKKEGLKLKTLMAIVAISFEEGLEGYQVKHDSIKIADIHAFLEYLQVHNQSGNVVIFWDNLRSHHSRIVQQQIQMLGWTCLFNAPYSSEYNCIEEYFAQAKRQYKKEMVTRDFEVTNTRHTMIVRKCIEKVELQVVRRIVDRHVQKIRQYQAEV